VSHTIKESTDVFKQGYAKIKKDGNAAAITFSEWAPRKGGFKWSKAGQEETVGFRVNEMHGRG